MKLNNKIVSFLREIGSVQGDNLCIPLAALDDATSTRVRTNDADREHWLRQCIEAAAGDHDATPDRLPAGEVRIDVFDLADAGFPEASVINPSYWAGIAPGSHTCFLCGYRAKIDTVREGRQMRVYLVLSPLTAEQVEKHVAKVRAAATKAKAKAKGKGTDTGTGTGTENSDTDDSDLLLEEDDGTEDGTEDGSEE